ncbi:major capsid protein VP39 [Adoxophyes honmai nucleopolyhedrovirus]|uniref:Major capsid protein VP39 n=1 Tax=Adoxophyes honmai nucleopolyhedrovirus TaxID=224399 RepID=Q80LM9_NPVAH|nr:major capsid protein VP39 [Adoxophyes honmai nucleopolyhedrovirus]BAC67318.1 major capsid protein VP39 [Adoxophyes honmai nucleopolyhedrovirus]
MALVPAGLTSSRSNSNCIFAGVQSFDACYRYPNECSKDADSNDGWYICEYHASVHFKMEKMSLAIPDADNKVLFRTVGRSLVKHTEEGTARILVPNKNNYESVLNVQDLPLAEALIIHMIYENLEKQKEICERLKFTEHFADRYKNVQKLYSNTMSVLNMANPDHFCAEVSLTSLRQFSNEIGNEPAQDTNFELFPKFIKNLVTKAVAPEIMKIGTEDIYIRNCSTCIINSTGLVADPDLYNPVKPKYRINYNENILRIENVLKFQGNANALQLSLGKYDQYRIEVPLILGKDTIYTTLKKPTLNLSSFARA